MKDTQTPGLFTNPEIRSAYTERKPYTWDTEQPSKTKQNFKDECDINVIMERFFKTGHIAHLNHQIPNYGYALPVDYREALEVIQQSEDSFATLPASIRQEFNNSPEEFMAFLQTDDASDYLADNGLLNPEATQAIMKERSDAEDVINAAPDEPEPVPEP